MYVLRAIDDWFDIVLREGRHPLVGLPAKLEVGWCNDLLVVENDSSAEEWLCSHR